MRTKSFRLIGVTAVIFTPKTACASPQNEIEQLGIGPIGSVAEISDGAQGFIDFLGGSAVEGFLARQNAQAVR